MMGNVANGTIAAAAFHAVTAKKLYSKYPSLRLKSTDISSPAVVIDVELTPAKKVTVHDIINTIHFFHNGQLKGLRTS